MMLHDRAAEYMARFGTASSVALLDPACHIFCGTVVSGIIGYKLYSNDVIVFGDPLCEPANLHILMREFEDHFDQLSRNIVYVATSENFALASSASHCEALVGIGHEIILNPTHDPRCETGKEASHLRGKCNQAVHQGVIVSEYIEPNITLEKNMEDLGETWVKGREGPQIYLHHVDVFAHREYKRYFYAEQRGKLIGFVILNRMEAHHGWLLSLSLIHQDAPKGTSELLIVSILEKLGKENCEYLTIGTVPISTIETIQGFGIFKSMLIRAGYALAKRFFNLHDRECYWKKFHPRIENTYLVFRKHKLGLTDVLSIIWALNAADV